MFAVRLWDYNRKNYNVYSFIHKQDDCIILMNYAVNDGQQTQVYENNYA